jgi:hypothetical protein
MMERWNDRKVISGNLLSQHSSIPILQYIPAFQYSRIPVLLQEVSNEAQH